MSEKLVGLVTSAGDGIGCDELLTSLDISTTLRVIYVTNGTIPHMLVVSHGLFGH